jgi:transaldolase
VEDHGEIRGDTILEGVDEAKRVLEAFEAAGIHYADVIETIEREGVEKFAKSFEDLIGGLESKLKTLVTA